MKQIILIAAIALSAINGKAQTDSFFIQYVTTGGPGGDYYKNIVPIAMPGTKPTLYLTRLHVQMPNDGSVAQISWELMYSKDSTNYIGSSIGGHFTMPVDQSKPVSQGKVDIFNYIKDSLTSIEWADVANQ